MMVQQQVWTDAAGQSGWSGPEKEEALFPQEGCVVLCFVLFLCVCVGAPG